MTRLACLAVLLTGCFMPLDNPDRCSAHDSLTSCTADETCVAATCAGCGSTTTFNGCYTRGQANPYGACPALGCAMTAACSTYTDASSCAAAPGCFAETCPGCGSDVFVGCFDASDPPPLHCAPIDCPAVCPQYDNDADCSANPGCYSLFKDGDTCDCNSAGCCMEFFQCATGPAQCGSGPSCDNPPLDLTCGAGYTTGVASGAGCVLGCIRDSLCTQGN